MVSWRRRRRSPRRERVRIRIRTSCVLPSDRRVLLRCKVAAAITPACPPPCAQRVIAHWYAQCLIRFASPVIPHACLQPSPCCCALTKRLHRRRPTGLLTWEGKHGDDDQWLFLTGNATRQAHPGHRQEEPVHSCHRQTIELSRGYRPRRSTCRNWNMPRSAQRSDPPELCNLSGADVPHSGRSVMAADYNALTVAAETYAVHREAIMTDHRFRGGTRLDAPNLNRVVVTP